MSSYVVLKFGGTSINKNGFQIMSNKIHELRKKGKKIIIVVSAIRGVTDNLIEGQHSIKDLITIYNDLFFTTIEKIHHNVNINNKDEIISIGETLSAYVVSEKLNIDYVNARNFIKCIQKGEKTLKLFIENIPNNDCFVTEGFVALTEEGEVKTLGRGGSDTTASVIANHIKAEYLEIYTDVSGIYTCDPNIVKEAYLIENIDYEIAQEMSALGANVLQHHSILPCKKENIPIYIRNTNKPSEKTTIISQKPYSGISIATQDNVSLFRIKSLDMWNDYGFVSSIYKVFKNFQIDINIITTSQFEISTTTNHKNLDNIDTVQNILKEKGFNVEVIYPCSIISIIGSNLNTKIFEKCKNILHNDNILITHFSSNNLSINFVIDGEYLSNTINKLHKELLNNKKNIALPIEKEWWYKEHIDTIINNYNVNKYKNVYLYSKNKIIQKCKMLKKCKNIKEWYYAMKANNNIKVINTIIEQGFSIECVSREEIDYLNINLENIPNILYTPNFPDIEDYMYAFSFKNIEVTVDNLYILMVYPHVFQSKSIAIRIDFDEGSGHNEKVKTEGVLSKFGIPFSDIELLLDTISGLNIKVIGLHAHKGSGILDYTKWLSTYNNFKPYLKHFPNIKWLNLGGGLGIVETNEDKQLDLEKFNSQFDSVEIPLRMEPGRFLVADSGILVCKVTGFNMKKDKIYMGISCGMNALLRPTLYNSFHSIYNISKLDQESNVKYDVVGQICESGDVFARNYLLPKSDLGDIIIISNVGAYGHVMASHYNNQDIPYEMIL